MDVPSTAPMPWFLTELVCLSCCEEAPLKGKTARGKSNQALPGPCHCCIELCVGPALSAALRYAPIVLGQSWAGKLPCEGSCWPQGKLPLWLGGRRAQTWLELGHVKEELSQQTVPRRHLHKQVHAAVTGWSSALWRKRRRGSHPHAKVLAREKPLSSGPQERCAPGKMGL